MGLIHLRLLASQDLTYYFPPPLALACPGLVTDGTLTLPYADFTPTIPSAMHNSVQTQSAQNTQLDQSDWCYLPVTHETVLQRSASMGQEIHCSTNGRCEQPPVSWESHLIIV